jgi:IS605 OrfB family transposase
MTVRCISKVADAYKADQRAKKNRKPPKNELSQISFRPLGAIAYDSRILSYLSGNQVSIWTTGGRVHIPYQCFDSTQLPYIQGEADLVFRKGKFFLYQTADIPEAKMEKVSDFTGCDLGITNIAVTSDEVTHTGEWINKYRAKRVKIRSSVQCKGMKAGASRSTTRNCRKLLKRLSGREQATATIINHTISKSLVASAKAQGKGIAIEELTHIRSTSKRKRTGGFRKKLSCWSSRQLRAFIAYKGALAGVKVTRVNPAYTSQTCSDCHHIGERRGQVSGCRHCGLEMNADLNSSVNLGTPVATRNEPEKSILYSCAVHYQV